MGQRPAAAPGQDRELIERVATFVRQRIHPWESELDRDDEQADARLAQLCEEAQAAGLWALPLPCELGGGGWGLERYAAMAVVEGRSEHGPAALGSASLLDVRTLTEHGSPVVRERYLEPLVSGADTACFAMTEPGARGSDPDTISTRAHRRVGSFEINGRKWFVTGARRADLVLVIARTAAPDPSIGPGHGLTVLAVPANSPGLRIERELPVWGAGGQYELRFDNVRVGAEHVLGEVDLGVRVAASRIALGRTLRSLRWIGQAERAFELLLERARDTTRAPSALGDHQLVQRLVFESQLALSSSRALVEAAVRAVNDPTTDPGRTAVPLAKVAASRALDTVADAAAQVYGAEGLGPDTALPRLQRAARQARVLDGADEVHVSGVARRLLRGRSQH
ncbi:acyl-CoA dehydrogenase family protein [Nocardiopsis sp. JB363]|uniref:acyl-CoA dehydrogenase family protein n=1 Tax=Nocardiopsis sp. JB363 TaxID=1434837 RepID=UPI00097A6F00|nr:acyl-CoA dehydrogenase family protein [Nocardiopsis sp. JB363]SIO89847.1 Butyryl-CoA dehydrogenase [Nocardiopsis sp. JB363]